MVPMVSPGDWRGGLWASPLHEEKGNSFDIMTLSSVEAGLTDLESPGETPQRLSEGSSRRLGCDCKLGPSALEEY